MCAVNVAEGATTRLTKAEQAYVSALFNELHHKIYRVAYRHLNDIRIAAIEDVVQETFKRACENLASLTSYDSPEAWLVMTAHHVASDEAKFFRRLTDFDDDMSPSLPESESSVDHVLPASLSQQDRALLLRYYVRRESSDEIAAALGENGPTIRKRLSRLRQKLKAHMLSPP